MYAAKVVDVHPEHHSVDVVLLLDNRRLPGVLVASWSMTGETGFVDLHVPDLTVARTEEEKWKSLNTEKRDIIAIIAWVESVPVCIGFVSPPACQMNFPKEIGEELRIDRHASDVYSTIDRAGNMEMAHPAGTWFGLVENPSKTKLTAKDYDKRWKVKRNLGRAVHAVASFWNGTLKKERARLHLDPLGALRAWFNQSLRLSVGQDSYEAGWVNVSQDGVVTAHADNGITITVGHTEDGATVTVGTPSFRPEEKTEDEVYEYPGTRPANNDPKLVITITSDGDVTLQTDGKVKVNATKIDLNGEVKINGVTQSGD